MLHRALLANMQAPLRLLLCRTEPLYLDDRNAAYDGTADGDYVEGVQGSGDRCKVWSDEARLLKGEDGSAQLTLYRSVYIYVV
jgi:hypothetical protein